jgi:hypothetical protein
MNQRGALGFKIRYGMYLFVVWISAGNTFCADPAHVPEAASEREYSLKLSEHRLALITFTVTCAAVIAGFFQYLKADKWKRAEFLAKEMHDFFNDKEIQIALTMIDWGVRDVQLGDLGDGRKTTIITREMQISALRPHTMDHTDFSSDRVALEGEDDKINFQRVEARIRDIYDRFLDQLSQFAAYVQTGLVSRREIDPYLKYWINDIAAETQNPLEAEWTLAFFVYIHFYDFENVAWLFARYDRDISIGGTLFNNHRFAAMNPSRVEPLVTALRAQKKAT